MKKRIHVNQHVIKRNRKEGADEPIFSVKRGKRTILGYAVRVDGPSRVIYRPDRPLSCGARAWIETDSTIAVEVHRGSWELFL